MTKGIIANSQFSKMLNYPFNLSVVAQRHTLVTFFLPKVFSHGHEPKCWANQTLTWWWSTRDSIRGSKMDSDLIKCWILSPTLFQIQVVQSHSTLPKQLNSLQHEESFIPLVCCKADAFITFNIMCLRSNFLLSHHFHLLCCYNFLGAIYCVAVVCKSVFNRQPRDITHKCFSPYSEPQLVKQWLSKEVCESLLFIFCYLESRENRQKWGGFYDTTNFKGSSTDSASH